WTVKPERDFRMASKTKRTRGSIGPIGVEHREDTRGTSRMCSLSCRLQSCGNLHFELAIIGHLQLDLQPEVSSMLPITPNSTPNAERVCNPTFEEATGEAVCDPSYHVYLVCCIERQVLRAGRRCRRRSALSWLPRSSSRFLCDAVLVLEREDGRPDHSAADPRHGGPARLRGLSSWARRS